MGTQNPNQFSQSVTKGMLDLAHASQIFGCQVDSAQSSPLTAGETVSIATTAGGVPKVIATANDTTSFFGIVLYNIKQAEFDALDALEIAAFGTVVYMEASAAITRFASVMVVVSGKKIATATTAKKIIGKVLDTALADGDLVRVVIADAIVDAVVPA